METAEKTAKRNILKSIEPEKVSGEIIQKRIISPWYVSDSHTIGEIAEILLSDSAIEAIGVADDKGEAKGVVVRNELFSLIGQKFGRELYLNKGLKEVMQPAASVYYKRNTFSVIDELSEELRTGVNRYYILINGENRYKGLISTSDLVLFLSEMMTRELKAARRIHSAIVTDHINFSDEKFEIAGSTLMAGETGGDFQHIKKLSEHKWFISLCDVSGKGLNAGLISVAVSSMYAVYDFSRGIDELLTRINSYINDLFEGEIFLTGVFIEFDSATGELGVYDMGHSMFYVLREGKAGSPANQEENLPLGIRKDIQPVKATIRLWEGDLVVSYTDGFPEQTNLVNEAFSERKLLSLAMKYRSSGLKHIQDILYDEVGAWRAGNAQGDDMSLVLLRYR